MSGYTNKLRVMIKTGVIVSNREASNPLLAYIAYAAGGIIFSVIALVPTLPTSSGKTVDLLAAFLMVVSMFDYIGIQTLVFRASLTDPSAVAVFPVSGTRSTATRFVVFLLEKRALFYLIPALVVSAKFLLGGDIAEAAVTILLYAFIYIIISEFLFAILPFFRGMAKRYSARAVMEIALLPILSILFIPELFRIRHAALVEMPVLSQFITTSEFVMRSDASGAIIRLFELLVIALFTGTLFLITGWSAARLPALFRLPVPERRTVARRVVPGAVRLSGKVNTAVASSGVFDDAVKKGRHVVRRLILHDWLVRQKEERLVQVLLSYAVFGFLLAQVAARNLPHPVESAVLPAFIVSQIIGFTLISNSLTRRGLRMRSVSPFPVDPVRFLHSKLLSSGILIVSTNLLVTCGLEVSWGMSFAQAAYGVVFSFFLPVILLLTDASLILSSPVFSRHAFLSITSMVIIELFATSIFITLMMFSPPLGMVFSAVAIGTAFFVWVPKLGRRMAAEFPKLLEE